MFGEIALENAVDLP